MSISVLYNTFMDDSQRENEWSSHGRYRLYWPGRPAATQKAVRELEQFMLDLVQNAPASQTAHRTPGQPLLWCQTVSRAFHPTRV